MLRYPQIKKYAQETNIPSTDEKALLVEYLQCEILSSLYDCQLARKLYFVGGTCLRLLHNLPRFSEDLDFDNLGLNKEDFNKLIKLTEKDLVKKGFATDLRFSYKGAFHAYLRFKNLLYDFDLSPHQDEKILIRLDTHKQDFDIEPQVLPLERYGIFQEVLTNPLDIIFAQKILALLERKRALGRDFYDVLFLAKKGIKPNFDYLKAKADIENQEQLLGAIADRSRELNFKTLRQDVERLLFNSQEAIKVDKFERYLKRYLG